MRFVTYAEDGGDRVGVLDHDGQVHALPPGVTMLDLLRHGTLREAGEQALSSSTTVRPLAEVRLRAPIPDPPTVRDFMTFERHVEGVAKLAGPDQTIPQQWYEAPAFYFTNPYAIRGPADDVPIAPGSRMFDLELEVAAVIGRTGRDVHPDDADAYIAGYTILIDWSARDLQFAEMQVRLGPTKGKDTATTLGPILVTPDELLPWRTDTGYDLAMTARINDKQIGTDHWSSMAFSFADMIAYASRGTPTSDRATSSAPAPAAAAASPNCGDATASPPTRPCNPAISSLSPSNSSAPSPSASPKASNPSLSHPRGAADRRHILRLSIRSVTCPGPLMICASIRCQPRSFVPDFGPARGEHQRCCEIAQRCALHRVRQKEFRQRTCLVNARGTSETVAAAGIVDLMNLLAMWAPVVQAGVACDEAAERREQHPRPVVGERGR